MTVKGPPTILISLSRQIKIQRERTESRREPPSSGAFPCRTPESGISNRLDSHFPPSVRAGTFIEWVVPSASVAPLLFWHWSSRGAQPSAVSSGIGRKTRSVPWYDSAVSLGTIGEATGAREKRYKLRLRTAPRPENQQKIIRSSSFFASTLLFFSFTPLSLNRVVNPLWKDSFLAVIHRSRAESVERSPRPLLLANDTQLREASSVGRSVGGGCPRQSISTSASQAARQAASTLHSNWINNNKMGNLVAQKEEKETTKKKQ